MASLMEELLDVLGKEEKQYQELITLATEKTDAVVQGNIEHLTDVTTREQDAASVLLNLSNKRNRVLTDMATVLGQSPEEMTITKMIGYLNKQPKEQEALTRQRDRLLEAGADVGRDDDRLFAGVVASALGQRPRDLGDDAGEDSALKADGLFRLSPMGEHLFHLGTVLRRCAGAHRVHVGHKAYTSVPDAPEGDGGVAYVNG